MHEGGILHDVTVSRIKPNGFEWSKKQYKRLGRDQAWNKNVMFKLTYDHTSFCDSWWLEGEDEHNIYDTPYDRSWFHVQAQQGSAQ